MPARPSPRSGPAGLRPREGLRPNSPHFEAGMRMLPPPSVACAMGKYPAATAAAAPPDDPPAECARLHGLRVGPKSCGSVVAARPNSGVLVLAMITRPAALYRATSVVS